MQHKVRIATLSAFLLASSGAMAQFGAVAVSPGAPGTAANATSDLAIAVGNNATAGTTGAGGFPTLAIAPSWSYTNQVAVGAGSVAWGAGDIALGAGTVAASQPSLGVTSAATAIGQAAASWGTNNTAIGYRALAGASSSGAPLANPTISNATALGGQASAQANSSTAVGANALALGINSVALGAGTVAGQDNTVAVGGRRIVGLANGTDAADAVTVQQLQAAIAAIPAAPAVDEAAIVSRANAYTDQQISGLRRELSRGIAAGAAAPALPALAPGERALAIGTGFYNGQTAIGVTVAQAFAGGAIGNAGMSTAGGKPVVRAGAAWKF